MVIKNFLNKDEFSSHSLPKNSVMIRNPENEQFIDAFINGNRLILKKVYQRLLGLANNRRNTYNLSSATTAEDIAQDCMMKLVLFCNKENALEVLNGNKGTRTWQQYVIPIIDNHTKDLYRKNKKMPIETIDNVSSLKTTDLVKKDEIIFVWETIATLSKNEQFLLRKKADGFKPHEISKLKWPELAKKLNISLLELLENQEKFAVEIKRFNDKIKKQLSRARKSLAEALLIENSKA